MSRSSQCAIFYWIKSDQLAQTDPEVIDINTFNSSLCNLETMNIQVGVGSRLSIRLIQQTPVENCNEHCVVVEQTNTNPGGFRDLLMNFLLTVVSHHNQSLSQDSQTDQTDSPVGHVDQILGSWVLGINPGVDQT